MLQKAEIPDIKEKIEATKVAIIEAEKVAAEAQNFERDFNEFIGFAFDIWTT